MSNSSNVFTRCKLVLINVALFACLFKNVLMSDEKMLIKKLLDKYEKVGKTGRPVQDFKKRVVISFGLSLIQILDLDEKNQILTVNVWTKYAWTDEMLRWNPKNYSKLTEIRIPPDKIWTPDIVLLNYADERLVERRNVMIIVDYTGHIVWLPPAILKSTCQIDITDFPFDSQTCHLTFSSWTYNMDKLDIRLYENSTEIDISDNIPNNEWKITAIPARRFVVGSGNESRPDITFFLFLKRNPSYFAYLLVVPCILLSSLTLVIFWLPPESPAKMILGMNIFVAFSLLLRLLAQLTPSASTSVPYLGYYYCVNMVLVTLSTFLTIIVINLYFRCDKRHDLPNWLIKIVNKISRFLQIKQEIVEQPKKPYKNQNRQSLASSNLKRFSEKIQNRKFKSNKLDENTMIKSISEKKKTNRYRLDRPRFSNFPSESSSSSTTTEKIIGKRLKTPAERVLPGDASFDTNHIMQTQKIFQCSTFANNMHSDATRKTKFKGKHGNADEKQISKSESQRFDEIRQMEDNLRQIRKALTNLMTKIAEKDRGSRIGKEWRMVAVVLDRMFFWVYLCIILMSGLILVPKGPQKSIEDSISKHYYTAYGVKT